MYTTQEKILERLNLLPENRLREVLMFTEFLISQLTRPIPAPQPPSTFAHALAQFRTIVATQGSDIQEVDFFENVRDCTLTPENARW